MKVWAVLLALPAFVFAWLPYGEALEKAAKDGRPVFVEFYADWCVPCLVMEESVFRDPEVRAVLDSNFHSAKLDVDSDEKIMCDGELLSVNACFADKLKLPGMPSFVIVLPNGMSAVSISGGLGPDGMLLFLQKVLNLGFAPR